METSRKFKAIRWYLIQAHNDALAVTEETDAVWLKRDVANDISMYTSDVHVQDGLSQRPFDYRMIGFTGYNDEFHTDRDCCNLNGEVKQIPETKALKWDYTYCEYCVD